MLPYYKQVQKLFCFSVVYTFRLITLQLCQILNACQTDSALQVLSISHFKISALVVSFHPLVHIFFTSFTLLIHKLTHIQLHLNVSLRRELDPVMTNAIYFPEMGQKRTLPIPKRMRMRKIKDQWQIMYSFNTLVVKVFWTLGTLTQKSTFQNEFCNEMRTTDKVTQKNSNKAKKSKIGFTVTKWRPKT